VRQDRNYVAAQVSNGIRDNMPFRMGHISAVMHQAIKRRRRKKVTNAPPRNVFK
jgi:hypothetical protein